MSSSILYAPTSSFRGVSPDSIPRYEIPRQVYYDEDDEPRYGSCWNCGHAVELYIGSKSSYMVCVAERDDGSNGEVSLCDFDKRECGNWEEDA